MHMVMDPHDRIDALLYASGLGPRGIQDAIARAKPKLDAIFGK